MQRIPSRYFLRESFEVPITWRVFSLFLAAAVGLAQFATVSPVLHEALHGGKASMHGDDHAGGQRHGSNKPEKEDHLCSVTLLAQGVVLDTIEIPSFFSQIGASGAIGCDLQIVHDYQEGICHVRGPPARKFV